MFIVERLPYDLTRSIFDHLDQSTLLDACLASKAINELASRVLYSSIVINREAETGYWYNYTNEDAVDTLKNPFHAFDRTPTLRNAVKHITIYRKYLYVGSIALPDLFFVFYDVV